MKEMFKYILSWFGATEDEFKKEESNVKSVGSVGSVGCTHFVSYGFIKGPVTPNLSDETQPLIFVFRGEQTSERVANFLDALNKNRTEGDLYVLKKVTSCPDPQLESFQYPMDHYVFEKENLKKDIIA